MYLTGAFRSTIFVCKSKGLSWRSEKIDRNPLAESPNPWSQMTVLSWFRSGVKVILLVSLFTVKENLGKWEEMIGETDFKDIFIF